MSSFTDIPVELLLRIFRFAVELDHPRALDDPLIDWSWNRILFERSLKLYWESMAIKTSLALVDQRWNQVAKPLLYEHIAIVKQPQLECVLRTLAATKTTTLEHRPHPQGTPLIPSGAHVRRLDLILGVSYASLEWGQWQPLGPAHLDTSIVQVFNTLPNLRILTMLLAEGIDDREIVLGAVPSRLEKFYWKHAGGPASISLPRVMRFLDAHPHLTHISLPPHLWDNTPSEGSWPVGLIRTPRPSVREYILQDSGQALGLSFLASRGLLPNVTSRRTVYPTCADPHDLDTDLTAVVAAHVTEQPGQGVIVDRTTPNSMIKSLTIVEFFSETWPTKQLADRLGVVEKLCPNLQEIELIIKGKTDFSSVTPRPSGVEAPRLPGVTTLSFQRMVSQGLMADPVRTLVRTLGLPWKNMFPCLAAIRIMEDLDFDEVKGSLNAWPGRVDGMESVRIEDRFGDALISSSEPC